MATNAGAFPIVGKENLREQPNKGFLGARQNSDVAYLEDKKETMPPNRSPSREVDEEFTQREMQLQQHLTNKRILQLLEAQAIQSQIAQAQVQPASNRSVDTLRRDIGIFAILLAMMVQTGAAFYWAGNVSKGQESAKETIKAIQDEQSYTRAQLQLIDGKLQKIEGRESERERNPRR